MKKHYFLTFITLLSVLMTTLCQAQNWDYESRPLLPFNIDHLDAELSISETGSIEGDLLYMITLKDDNPDSLIFDAREMEILSTVIDGNRVDYYIDSDKLIIQLDDEFSAGDDISLRIQYRAQPQFGLSETAKGTFFTSLLPKAVSHWLPVADHPILQFTTEMIFTHPSGLTLISNGSRSSEEIENVSEQITTYTSGKPISPTELSFVMGELEMISSTRRDDVSGSASALFERRSDNHIQIYSEVSDPSSDRLFETAVDSYKKLLDYFGIGYPFRELSIVVLEDDFWETKSNGGGIIYLFKNRGDLVEQLKRNMTGLWIGSHHRAEQWNDANAVLAMQARVNAELFDLEYILDDTPAPYHVYDGAMESVWRHAFEQDSFSQFTRHLDRVRDDLISEKGGIISWRKLSDAIYEHSGYPYYQQLDLPEITVEEPVEYEYLATMTLNDEDQNVSIEFQALDEPVEELVTVRVDEITFDDEKSNEITFTGAEDTIVLNTSAGTENIKLTVSGRDDINLDVRKPFEFWVYQLRNETDAAPRIEAAKALMNFSDNPDLQLALRDQMREEENSEVYAELLRTYAAVTSGASGTDETMLNHLSSSYSEEVQLAAVEGLAYFRENDQVISRLRSLAHSAESEKLRIAAIRSLRETTDAERFKVIAEDLITQESALHQVPLILNLLAESGEEEAAVQFSSTFLAEGFPYRIRAEILTLVLELDQSADGWENRLPTLLEDRDPRIRLQSLNALDRTGRSFRDEWKERRLAEEYDERVRRVLENF